MGEEGGQATVLIRIESVDSNSSRIDVAIDTPDKTINIGGTPMVVDEHKIQMGFRKGMAKYAEAVRDGKSRASSLAAASEILDMAAVIVDDSSMDLAQRLESNPELGYKLANSMGG